MHFTAGPKNKAALITKVCLFAALACFGYGQNEHPGRVPTAVSPANVYEYVRRLASPEFAGRLTGANEYRRTAEWAAGLFRQWGLQGFDDKGYLQAFPTEYTSVESSEMSLLLAAQGSGSAPQEIRLEPGRDFLPLLFSAMGDRTAEAVFAGWGISAPELNYDDYAGLDVRNRFVLCYRGTPDSSDSRFTDHDQHRTRMSKAHEKGALGIIYIYDEPIANPNGDWIRDFTPAVISRKVADTIFKPRGIDSSTLRSDLLKYKRPVSFDTGVRIRLAVRSAHDPDGTGLNVIGILPGSDPALRQEYVVVGAHADHCGRLMDLLFPGANDNASGTAAVMEIARNLSAAGNRPKRSVVFALFAGEECGLKGSQFFTGHLQATLQRPVAMLNFDMVGEGDAISCGYTDTPQLKALLEQVAARVPALRSTSTIRSIGVQSSDFSPFFERGIPCLSFSSNGPHLSYHETGDTIYRINPDILAEAARIGLVAITELANR